MTMSVAHFFRLFMLATIEMHKDECSSEFSGNAMLLANISIGHVHDTSNRKRSSLVMPIAAPHNNRGYWRCWWCIRILRRGVSVVVNAVDNITVTAMVVTTKAGV